MNEKLPLGGPRCFREGKGDTNSPIHIFVSNEFLQESLPNSLVAVICEICGIGGFFLIFSS